MQWTQSVQPIPASPCDAFVVKRLTLWCQDEARVGQKGRTCRRWFTKGVRPPGLCDQRYTWAHLFAAVRPSTGQAFALVLPEASTKMMQVFLDQFAARLDADEHAIMLLDQAGWHGAHALVVPNCVTLVPLPPYAPQLNPVEPSTSKRSCCTDRPGLLVQVGRSG